MNAVVWGRPMSHCVLIVDDSILTRAAIRRVIDMLELDVDPVLEASNGREALALLEQSSVDLILADLHMPDMDGVELVHRLKGDPAYASIPVAVISAESNQERLDELRAEGVVQVLHKPFTPEAFRALLEQNVEWCHD